MPSVVLVFNSSRSSKKAKKIASNCLYMTSENIYIGSLKFRILKTFIEVLSKEGKKNNDFFLVVFGEKYFRNFYIVAFGKANNNQYLNHLLNNRKLPKINKQYINKSKLLKNGKKYIK